MISSAGAPADDTPETCIYSNWSPWSACSSATCEKGKRMRQRMLKAQLDLSVPCPHTADFEPCMGPGCSDEGECLSQSRATLHNDVKLARLAPWRVFF